MKKTTSLQNWQWSFYQGDYSTSYLLAKCFQARGTAQMMVEKAMAAKRENRMRYSRPSTPS